MTPLAEQLKKLIPELIERFPPIEVLYLFGSNARAAESGCRDVDIGVFLDSDGYVRDPLIDLNLGVYLQDSLGKEVDVVAMNRSSSIVQHEILRTGIRLFERNPASRAMLELNSFRDYLDVRHYQQRRFNGRLSRGVICG